MLQILTTHQKTSMKEVSEKCDELLDEINTNPSKVDELARFLENKDVMMKLIEDEEALLKLMLLSAKSGWTGILQVP